MQLGQLVLPAPWVPEALWAIQALLVQRVLLASLAPSALREIPALRVRQVSLAPQALLAQQGRQGQKVPWVQRA